MPPAEAATPRPATACPLCGGPNDCAPATCGSFATPCWCASVRIAPALLERIPTHLRGQACICRRCAEHGEAARLGAGEAAPD